MATLHCSLISPDHGVHSSQWAFFNRNSDYSQLDSSVIVTLRDPSISSNIQSGSTNLFAPAIYFPCAACQLLTASFRRTQSRPPSPHPLKCYAVCPAVEPTDREGLWLRSALPACICFSVGTAVLDSESPHRPLRPFWKPLI